MDMNETICVKFEFQPQRHPTLMKLLPEHLSSQFLKMSIPIILMI